MRAQKIIQKYSPERHCCTLYYDENVNLDLDMNQAMNNSDGKTRTSLETAPPQEHENGRQDDPEEEDDIEMEDLQGGQNFPSKQRNDPQGLPRTPPPAQNPGDSTSSSGPTTSMPPSILKKPIPIPIPPSPHVEQVKMDVGVGVPVTLSMLHERGRETVRPLLEEFVKEVGPELSKKCLVRFS